MGAYISVKSTDTLSEQVFFVKLIVLLNSNELTQGQFHIKIGQFHVKNDHIAPELRDFRFVFDKVSDSNPNLKFGFGYPNLRFESGRPKHKT